MTEPELLEPDAVYEVTLEMWGTSNVFLPGHRLRLEVASRSYPRFDRNTNSGGKIADDTADEFVRAVNRVHHGPRWPSRLLLPVISRT